MIETAWTPDEVAVSIFGIGGEAERSGIDDEEEGELELSGVCLLFELDASDLALSSNSISKEKSSSMNATSFWIFSARASWRANRLDAGPFCASVRPAPGDGADIEMMPLMSSDTTECMDTVWYGERRSTKRGMRRSFDSHYRPLVK